ncbi:MAG: DUF2062 domain-containing protein [Planctomycetota bacterium]
MKKNFRPKRTSRPLIRFIKFRILHINDTPHRLAMGVALGFFVAYLPFYGTHILIVLPLAYLFRANRFTALLAIWLNNPLTIFPISYTTYIIGQSARSIFTDTSLLTFQQTYKLFSTLDAFPVGIFSSQFWNRLTKIFMQVGLELTVGGFILGTLLALCGYFLTAWLIRWHRKKHPHRRFAQQ